MMPEFKTCCFTGHRGLPDEKRNKIQELLLRTVEELCKNGCSCFISGGAVGFDMMAAETVIKAKQVYPDIKLIMLLPCRDQHAKWCADDRRRYAHILKCADESIYVCEKYITGCMHLRNKRMVERADVCVAYYEKKGGGTEYTVNYAAEKDCPVVNLAEML